MAEQPHITPAELSRLKDEVELFKQSEIWQMILVFMQHIYRDVAEEALHGNDMLIVKHAGGMADAIDMISKFDDNIPVLRAAKEAK